MVMFYHLCLKNPRNILPGSFKHLNKHIVDDFRSLLLKRSKRKSARGLKKCVKIYCCWLFHPFYIFIKKVENQLLPGAFKNENTMLVIFHHLIRKVKEIYPVRGVQYFENNVWWFSIIVIEKCFYVPWIHCRLLKQSGY